MTTTTEISLYLDSLMDQKATAKFLGVGIRTLENWRSKNKGPNYIKISWRCVRYRRRDLLAFCDKFTNHRIEKKKLTLVKPKKIIGQ